MSCECPAVDDSECQPVPTTGSLARNLNTSFDEIVDILRNDSPGDAYCYTMTSVRSIDGAMRQCGSGPNIQGGYVTLCTCKRYMRTFRNPEDWRGVWIIGMSGTAAGVGHAVFYMMKVQAAFESHYDLWHADLLSASAKRAKSASRHRLGDLYEPSSRNVGPFDPDSYKEPDDDHSHYKKPHGKNRPEWQEDIDYVGMARRRPALLVGDPEMSFIWETPLIYPRFKTHRGQKRFKLDEFTALFEE